MSAPAAKDRSSALGDAAGRDYAEKLSLFFRLAEPEIRRLISGFDVKPGDRVLDAGCGAGQTARLLAEQTGAAGMVVGLDLSRPHLAAARRVSPGCWLQASLSEPPFPANCFDTIWCANSVHHARNPVLALQSLHEILRPGGRIALCQSALLPDMVFAWDSELESAVHAACRRYYREKYVLNDDHAVAWRRGIGWLREAGFERPRAETIVVERTAPLDDATRAYIEKGLFAGYWGQKSTFTSHRLRRDACVAGPIRIPRTTPWRARISTTSKLLPASVGTSPRSARAVCSAAQAATRVNSRGRQPSEFEQAAGFFKPC